MRFELISCDEYEQTSILKSANNIEDIIAEAHRYVTGANCDNALAASEREKAWEACFPVVMKGKNPNPDVVYAGNRRNGKHQVYVKDKKGKYSLVDLPKEATVRFVLGDVPTGTGKQRKTETWYLADFRGKFIEDLKSPELHAKTVLFIKVA